MAGEEFKKGKTDKKEGEEFPYGPLLLGVLVIACLPVLLLSVAGFLLGRDRVRRNEAIAVAVASFVVSVVRLPQLCTRYGHWVESFFTHTHGSPWAIPFLPLTIWTAFLTSAAIAASSTERGAKFVARIGRPRKNPLQTESILPTDMQKRQARVVTPPGGHLTIDAAHHSIVDPRPVGQRCFPLGYDARRRPVELSEAEIKTHGFILGSTGSGKTEALKAMIGHLGDLGWDVIMLDLKEDTQRGGLRDFCRDYSHSHALPYQELALSDPNPKFWFSPLMGMGRDEVRDTILSLMAFDDEHWQNINKKLLGELISLYFDVHQVDPIKFPLPTMYDIGKVLSAQSLNNATKAMRATLKGAVPGYRDDEYSSLATPSQDEQKSATGLGAKLVQMYATQAGRTVLRPSEHTLSLDVTTPGLIYIGLDTMGKPDLTKVVSSAILQRMSVYAAERTTGKVQSKSGPRPKALIIDEANWINRTIVMNLLSRARSAGICVWLATQSATDWSDEKGDDWPKITANTNCAIIMRQGEPVSAEICAEYIGKKQMTQFSARVTEGEIFETGSARSTWDYIVQPDEIRSLQVGEAILRVGVPQNRVTWLAIRQREAQARATSSRRR